MSAMGDPHAPYPGNHLPGTKRQGPTTEIAPPRAEAHGPARLLARRAEMRLPGRAWLQFEVDGDEQGSRIHQTAIFDPVGVAGLLYWFALLPLHRLVFAGTLAGIAQRATLPTTPARPRPRTESLR